MPRLLIALLLASAALAPAARGAVQDIPGPGSTNRDAAVAANARGDAVIAWATRARSVYVAFAERGGRFGRPRRVPGSDRGGQPRLVDAAIDARGDAVLAWASSDRSDPAERVRLRAAVRRRSGRLTRVRTLSPPAEDVVVPLVAAAGGRMAVSSSGGGPIALGDRSGLFPARFALPAQTVLLDLALTARRLTAYARGTGRRGGAELVELRHRTGGPGRLGARPLFGGGSGFDFSYSFAGNGRGGVLGVVSGADDRRHLVAGRHGRLLRDVRLRAEDESEVAIAESGRGVAAFESTARHPAKLAVRLRGRGGRLGPVHLHRVARRQAGLVAAAVNDAGRYVVLCTEGPRFGSEAVKVLSGGRTRTIWPRPDAGYPSRRPIHIDARGRLLVVFITGRRIRAWRG